MSIFDLVTAKNVAEYWIEKNVNEQPLLGETLFPAVREIGIKLEWIKGAKNQPVGLRLAAYDTKAIRRDRKGFESYETTMPFFKESMYIDEELRQKLNTLIQTNNEQVVNQILTKIFNDEIELIKAARVTLERMRMEALSTGAITLASNGQAYSYDYGVPTDQKVDVSTVWSDPSADIIGDITKFVEDMKAKGVTITRAVCNSSVAKNFRTNTALKNAIYVFANGTVNITTARALDYIYNETGISIYVYDNVYVNESGDAVKYVPDNTLILLPEGTLGETHFGVTPEESDLMTLGTAKVSIVDNGIAVTTYGTEDPVNVETKVSMVALPSFERANEIVIVDTATAA
nr:MAG TPA: Major capsid protein [Bacteriophage sp.]